MDVPKDIIKSTIGRGDILHSTSFADIDHGKFFVVIGVFEEYVAGFFYVNSNINKYIESKPEQFNMQYIIRPADYPFLKHDSFVSAVAIQKIELDTLVEDIMQGNAQIISSLKRKHIDELLDMVRKSKLFSAVEKKRYFY